MMRDEKRQFTSITRSKKSSLTIMKHHWVDLCEFKRAQREEEKKIQTFRMAQQKVVLKLLAMNDEKTKQKAIEAVADIYGIDSIAADLKDQKMTIIGEMDTVAIAKKLKKIGKIDIISVGPAKEEKKDDKKDAKPDDKKDAKK
ncbi:hypothetical protein HPP92_022561 [Vanilla planifolia]|uniref:HMA domain-containing protein n=1 Tax=Vanilla planifolia TaxID=51239 RepID=A0A835UC14_VANPL|nr:hypothetical protein HPP92_022561 [Vanilla planifolia]